MIRTDRPVSVSALAAMGSGLVSGFCRTNDGLRVPRATNAAITAEMKSSPNSPMFILKQCLLVTTFVALVAWRLRIQFQELSFVPLCEATNARWNRRNIIGVSMRHVRAHARIRSSNVARRVCGAREQRDRLHKIHSFRKCGAIFSGFLHRTGT